ncbi:glycosyltransferase family 4 protein [Microcella sp.]|uniref:glycosyltransferase family 4 protein n=1 Tax=Microcella sp. TaxID=1913979 RepID=UPI00299F531C|nr:glycosyltransferase family 4 protein [Microcella sp.]MDX2026451.1 glycosyltransferase family 4 protein [Microcella sp.]
MTRVLIITGDPLAAAMAGPAIRAWNMALTLQQAGHEARLVSTTRAEHPSPPFPIAHVAPGDERGIAVHERWAEVVLFQGYANTQFRTVARTDRMLIADAYDPMHLEMLEQGRELPPPTWALRVSTARDALNDQLRRADLILCASERQRLLYLGQLAGLGRLSPATYAEDPDLRALLDVVPFGLEPSPPVADAGHGMRGVIPGIDADSRVLIWGGGVYSWFDPLTLIRAVGVARERVPGIRLFFLGTRHPGVDEMGIVRESFDLATSLGLEGREVIFNDTWVPYDRRGAYLVEANAGVSTHHVHVETTFSFRTRILDYLWAGLPMVVTEGDGFAEIIAAENLGIVVPANDVDALADALTRVLADSPEVAEWRANVARVRERFVWSVVLQPLLAAVAHPRRAADVTRGRDGMGVGARVARTAGFGHTVRMTLHHLRAEGISGVTARVRKRLSAR